MKLLDTIKLPRDFYYRRPRQLSGGHKQRIGIARAFTGNSSMVIADEPVIHVPDPSERIQRPAAPPL